MAGRAGKKEAGKSTAKPAKKKGGRPSPARKSGSDLADLYDLAPVGFFTFDAHAQIVDVNTACADLLGIVPRKLLKLKFKQFVAPSDAARWERYFADVLKYRKKQTCELLLSRQDGSTFKARMDGIRVDTDTKASMIHAVISDITSGRQIEKQTHVALEKYKILFESFPLGISITDNAGNLVETNKESERLLGITRDEHLQRTDDGPEWQIIRPDGTPMPHDEYASVRALKENRRIENVEMGIVKSGNEITWINVTAEPIPLENYGVAITYGDISERKMLEKDLEKERRDFKLIADSSPIIVFYKDSDGRFLHVNKTFAQALNMSEEEFIGKTVYDLYSANIAQAMTDDDREVLKSGLPKLNIEEQYESASGTRWVQTDKVPIFDDNGAAMGLVGFAQDITGRKISETALKESEEKYRSLVETAASGIASIDLEGKFTFANDRLCQWAGLTTADILGQPFADFLHPDDLPGLMEIFLNAARGERTSPTIEFRIINKDGRVTWLYTNPTSIILDDKTVGFNAILHDITQRKLAEEKIGSLAEESQWLLKSMINAFVIFESIFDKSGKFVSYRFEYINEAYEKITSVKLQDVRGKTVHEVWPETEPSWIENYGAVAVSGVPRTFNMYHKPTDKTYHCTVYRPWPTPQRFCVIFEDITEILRADKALRESEAQYRLLAEHTTDTVWLMDMNLKTTYTSPSSERLLGFTQQELMEMPLEKYITPDSLRLATESFFQELPRVEADPNYNPIITLELEYYCKDGTTLWAENKFNLIRDENGKPVSILGETRDITGRKQTEEALRQSEIKYGTILEQIKEAYYELDLAGNLTFVNDATCRQLGYPIEELMGMNYRIYVSKEDAQRIYEIFNQVYRTGNPKMGFPVCEIRKDGTQIFTENSALPLQNENGQIIGFRGVAHDITVRKRAEEAIRKSEAQYRLLADHTTDFIWLMDMDLTPTYQSPSAERLTGFTSEELMELPFEKRVAPESLKLAAEMFLKEIPRIEVDPDYNPIIALELEIFRKDGTSLWSENKFSVIRDENRKPIAILGEARDITERREAERKLEQTLSALEKTLRDTVIAISKMVEMKDPFTAGHQIRVAQLATAIARKMNLPEEQVSIINTAATIHDIGKIYVPSDILSKPGKLGSLEYEIIQTHARGSYEILKEIDFKGQIAQIVYQHHERLDGSGYPRALKGDDILPEAKILIVADVVEAMSSHRPYRAALGIEKALEEITLNRGKLYDEAAVDACLELFRNDRFEFTPVSDKSAI